MVGYIKVISSLLLVYVISLNTTDWNRKITNENKGHGQICLTWGGVNSVVVVEGISGNFDACSFYLLRFGSEYKYLFDRYVGIVFRLGVLDGSYRSGSNFCSTILSLGVGLEWSYNGIGSKSRINKTYYGGSIGVLGLWGGVGLDVQGKLTPFKMRKPYGLYMSVDFGCLDIRGLRSGNGWVKDGIFLPTLSNMAFNIGWSWWI